MLGRPGGEPFVVGEDDKVDDKVSREESEGEEEEESSEVFEGGIVAPPLDEYSVVYPYAENTNTQSKDEHVWYDGSEIVCVFHPVEHGKG